MLMRVSRFLVFVILISSSTSQNDVTGGDAPLSTTTPPDEPMVIRLEEVKIYQRHFRIILEAGMNENCFSVEVEPTQHLNVDYTVRILTLKSFFNKPLVIFLNEIFMNLLITLEMVKSVIMELI